MPVDRFFHPRAGHSRKVTLLTDLEFRVWWTYQMVADDYGIMRRSVIVLQAANDALAKRSRQTVDRALDRVVEVGLLVPFGHQDDWFVCQLDWQDFQKVRYPRESLNPMPPSEVLLKCSGETQDLFRKRSGETSEIIPDDSSRAGTREEANGLRLTANGKRQEVDADFETFRDAYPVSRRVGGKVARNAFKTALCQVADLRVLLAALEQQKGSAQWQEPKLIPLMTTWLHQDRWLQVLPEASHKVGDRPLDWTCPSEPPCPAGTTAFQCHQRAELEAARKVRAS